MNSDVSLGLRRGRQRSEPKSELVRRLKIAVRIGGGNKAVAKLSGIPLGTLNNYTREIHRMPVEAATQIAAVCNVSIDWLLRGEGPMEYLPVGHVTKDGHVVGIGPVMPIRDATAPEPRQEQGLMADDFIEKFNPERLAKALQAADQMFAAENRRPTYRQRIHSMILFYNHLTKLQAILDQEDAETESNAPTP